ESAIDSVLLCRRERGAFTSLTHFCEDLDLRLVNKRVLESLIKSGALDSLGFERSRLAAGLDRALDAAQGAQRDRIAGQDSLFGAPATRPAAAHGGLPD